MNTEFLFHDYLDDVSICDELIEFHKNSDDKQLGTTGYKYDPKVKDSTDVLLKPDNDLAKRYVPQLQKVTDKYIKLFPFSDFYSRWTIVENICIQHYAPPKQAFKAWHTERGFANQPNAARHLVFMTYLNDVNDGGETEWYHQNIKLAPRKGLTAIWPVDWTYTHRGNTSETEHKYIVTGWYSFY